MYKEMISGKRGYFQLVHGVTVKAIDAFTDAELDFRPNASMRSVRELIFHIYATEKSLIEGLRAGCVTAESSAATIPEKPEAAATLATLKTVVAAQDFARQCHQASDAALEGITEEQLTADVGSPFGSFPAWQYVTFAYDEHWHHRGQLYTYLRLLGKEPLMLYSYDGPVN